MRTPSRLLYLLTDGGRARLVRRSSETGHFSTVEQIDGAAELRTLRRELRASPPTRTFASAAPRRSAVGQEDFARPVKEAFVARVADRVIEVARRDQLDGVVLAAPPRLIGPLQACLGDRIAISGQLRKDLTKAPDHELGSWLNKSFIASPGA
jgi:protein required for attachment to host cells